MKMRHELESGGKPYAHDIDARPRWVSIGYGGLGAGADGGCLPYDVVGHDDDAFARALGVSTSCNPRHEQQHQTNFFCAHCILLACWFTTPTLTKRHLPDPPFRRRRSVVHCAATFKPGLPERSIICCRSPDVLDCFENSAVSPLTAGDCTKLLTWTGCAMIEEFP